MQQAPAGAYNHHQWMIDTAAGAQNLLQIQKVLHATLPYLNAVGAGATQVSGTIQLAEEAGFIARNGDLLRTRWDSRFRDLGNAVTAARGDHAEDKNYAQ